MKWIYTRNVSISRENTRKWQLTRHSGPRRYQVNIGMLKNSPRNQDKPPNTGPVSPTKATAFSVCLVNPTDYQIPLWYVHLKQSTNTTFTLESHRKHSSLQNRTAQRYLPEVGLHRTYVDTLIVCKISAYKSTRSKMSSAFSYRLIQ